MSPPDSSRWLNFPRALWLSLLLALLLGLPSLPLGPFNDDYGHLIVLENILPTLEGPSTRFDLFRFVEGDPATLRPLLERGVLPWWTHPELKLAFWRPLSSALMVLDQALFGYGHVGSHLHSVAWYVALVAMAGLLLRRVLPGALGALALLLFAVDDAHALPVVWLANRNALVAATPALLGLWLHVEGREAHRPWARPLSLLALALGLMGGEVALGVAAHLVAYEALGARGPASERLRAILPPALLVLAWLAAYKVLGYGAWGSGMYVDPLAQPGTWLLALAGRLPALLGGLFLGVPVDLWAFVESSRPWLVGVGVAAVVLMALVLRAAWGGLSEDERRHTRWLLAGAVLSLLPVASTIPTNRLLLVPSLGGAVAVAAVLRHAWRSRPQAWRPRPVAAAAALLALAHFALAVPGWALLHYAIGEGQRLSEHRQQVLERELDVGRVSQQRVVLLSSPDPVVAMYTAMGWLVRGRPVPRAWWTLSMAPGEHVVTRTGPDTLELERTQGPFFASEWEQLYRAPLVALAPGDTVELQGLRVQVLEGDAQGPRRLRFTFDTPLEDPSLVLLQWREGALHKVPPPSPGERRVLPGL